MITVLRLGHRIYRDKRITTHVALVARAFGAEEIIIDTKDDKLEKSIKSTCVRFGGNFEIRTGINPKKFLSKWNGKIAHLTMYGEKLKIGIKKIKRDNNLLIIVGAAKVPPWIYDMADYNISVGNQPHSEVSALALFLDRYNNGSWINKKFNGKVEILPSNKRKMVIDNR